MVYLLGSVLLCQLPLLLLFVNRIKPLPPRKLFKVERYVIVAAFLISMIMAPTTNVLDQLIIAGPIILMYNLSIGLIWLNNRNGRLPDHVIQLIERDKQIQAARFNRPTAPLGNQQPALKHSDGNRIPEQSFSYRHRQVMDIRRPVATGLRNTT